MYVYILENINGQNYVGMSKHPQLRLKEHNNGHIKSTKSNRPWKIIYTDTFANRIEARKKEKYLKSAAGRRFRKTLKQSPL